MTKAILNTYSIIHEYKRKINLVLLATCLTLAIIYAINLYSVVSHSIALQNIVKEQALLDSSVQSLETQYLAISSKITPDTLQSYGFDKGKITAFISRTTSLGIASLGTHEL